MILSACYPAIVTRDVKRVVQELEKLGFAVVDQRKSMIESGKRVYAMQHPCGMRTDVVGSNLVFTDTHVAHVEIRNFEEGLEVHKNNGFTVVKEPRTDHLNKAALIKSSDGFMILLVQRIGM